MKQHQNAMLGQGCRIGFKNLLKTKILKTQFSFLGFLFLLSNLINEHHIQF